MNCNFCNKTLEINYVNFCSEECASKANGNKKRFKRICTCGKIEFISNKFQLTMQCRSCSKLGNTASQGMSVESRKKISEAKKGKPAWNSGKTGIYSEEIKKKMGAKNKGKKLTKYHKENITNGLNIYYKNNKGPNLGKVKSESEKQKIKDTFKKKRHLRIHTTLKEAKTFCEKLGLILIKADSEDNYVSKSCNITVKCNNKKKDGSICNNTYETTLNYLEFNACLTCKGCSNSTSKPEQEIYNFLVEELKIKETDILRNKRPQFMKGKS